MQISLSIFILLVIIGLIGVKASPVGNNMRGKRMAGGSYPSDIIFRTLPPVYHFCGVIGDTCKNVSNCCANYDCDYPSGYDYDSTRCCGLRGALGCKMTETSPGSGCCFKHYCAWINQTAKTTRCEQFIYKKKRGIEINTGK